jgi:hypothetical protein
MKMKGKVQVPATYTNEKAAVRIERKAGLIKELVWVLTDIGILVVGHPDDKIVTVLTELSWL